MSWFVCTDSQNHIVNSTEHCFLIHFQIEYWNFTDPQQYEHTVRYVSSTARHNDRIQPISRLVLVGMMRQWSQICASGHDETVELGLMTLSAMSWCSVVSLVSSASSANYCRMSTSSRGTLVCRGNLAALPACLPVYASTDTYCTTSQPNHTQNNKEC